MELVALLRTLWRFRIAVALGGIVAIGLGFVATRGATTHFGVASMRVVLDTPRSQTVDVEPEGAATLEWRAALLADLVSAEPARQGIARSMGIPVGSLVVTAPYRAVPEVPYPLPRAALDAAAVMSEPYQLSVQAATLLPIVGIDARAPSREQAARLATAAARALETASVSEVDGYVQKMVVEDVGPPKAKEIVDRPRRIMAVVVTALAFGLWCTCVTVLDGLSRRRRAALRTRTAGLAWP
jgi:hypothetical protein